MLLLVGAAVLSLVFGACGRDRNAEAALRCDPTAAGAVDTMDMDKLAWLSDQIVVGTVIEVPDIEASPPAQPLAVLKVESRIRGRAADTLLLYACQFDHPGAIFLTPGERMLIFAMEIRSVDGEPVDQYVGEQQGLWRITASEFVESPVVWSADVPLADVRASVYAALADGPDDLTARHSHLVPLDEAPLVDAP